MATGRTLPHWSWSITGHDGKHLHAIIEQARERWQLQAATIIHRVGRLALGEAIVLVVTASSHRKMPLPRRNS
jgi:molybdopterin synthase catalytic subunit